MRFLPPPPLSKLSLCQWCDSHSFLCWMTALDGFSSLGGVKGGDPAIKRDIEDTTWLLYFHRALKWDNLFLGWSPILLSGDHTLKIYLYTRSVLHREKGSEKWNTELMRLSVCRMLVWDCATGEEKKRQNYQTHDLVKCSRKMVWNFCLRISLLRFVSVFLLFLCSHMGSALSASFVWCVTIRNLASHWLLVGNLCS